ncbi:SDR family oxidoreductase [Parvibium lacunae]|uniref:Short-chain dehydrogenase n=1 Tax=Parvibium lacunae TaxID=1888893 RepID=A0A368L0K5_9BURK|nr:SDR family oxidoreductase [Parvibium lacunae]RCS57093.1 short-chain dehydrogenase [Parvibium lacunae]
MRVLITGASSGIGAALARAYAAQGAQVYLLARRAAALEAVRQSLPEPNRHQIFVADVTVAASLQQAAQACLSTGVPDIVIANAGVSVGTLTEYADDLQATEEVIQTNLLALIRTFQPFIQPMKARGGGTLVSIASVAGIRGLPGAGAYSAAKAAVIAYTESLRVELRGSGIEVVTLAPGYIRTPMTAHNPYPMPFMLDADEFARRAQREIARGTSYTVIPWQMGVVAKGLRLLPNWLYDRLFQHAGRKPRAHELAAYQTHAQAHTNSHTNNQANSGAAAHHDAP